VRLGFVVVFFLIWFRCYFLGLSVVGKLDWVLGVFFFFDFGCCFCLGV